MKQKRTFTLVEVAIVASLFAIVGLVLVSTFANGIKIWKRIYAQDTRMRASIFLEEFTSDIRNAVDIEQIPFEGDEYSFALTTHVRTQSRTPALSKGIGTITYQWNEDTATVRKTVKNINHLYKNSDGIQKEVLRDVSGFALRYYTFNPEAKAFMFKDKWSPEDGIPLAVRINISIGYQENAQDFVKTLWIPVGKL